MNHVVSALIRPRALKLLRYFAAYLLASSPSGFTSAAAPAPESQASGQKLAREIFCELIEINTTPAKGSTQAAEAMAARLKAAGFSGPELRVLGARPDRQNVVATIRGNGAHRPLLFIGHLDVVEALPQDWSFDPFKFTERDGYYYGRGTSDMKGADAVLVTTFIRLRTEGFVPDRDLILALTADEEIESEANGVAWLLAHQRSLIEA